MEKQPGDCPPLELLFTVDEETGLTGAKTLDSKALGLSSKTLVNLDTEVWGEICIGCAGGGDVVLDLKVESPFQYCTFSSSDSNSEDFHRDDWIEFMYALFLYTTLIYSETMLKS